MRTGPLQVGKTSLARRLLPRRRAELNCDVAEQRAAILQHRVPGGSQWFFDEIHKFRGWRNYLKGACFCLPPFGAPKLRAVHKRKASTTIATEA